MKIGLIDVDGNGKFPNIALMKLSTYLKNTGNDVEWYSPFNGHYDIVYMSKVFSFTPDYQYYIDADKIVKGGTGYAIKLVDGKEVYNSSLDLPLPMDNADTYHPDYSLYPHLTKDTAYGFLTRGCPRGCGFCIVKWKEGYYTYKVADLTDFWDGQKNIVLCDPNILAYRGCLEEIERLAETGAYIDFNQGLDIRMMTRGLAASLCKCRMKEVHFAWDRYEDKNNILPKLEMFSEYRYKGRNPDHNAIVYTIVNYSTTFEQDLERVCTLRDLGYWAYIMIYDKAHCDYKYRQLQRWVNNRIIFSKCLTFEQYLKNTGGAH